MQDREISRLFKELSKRIETLENTKPGEPVLGSELDKTLRRIETSANQIDNKIERLTERVDNHILFFKSISGVFLTGFLIIGGYIYTQQGRISRVESSATTAQLENSVSGPLTVAKVQKVERILKTAKDDKVILAADDLSSAGITLVQATPHADPEVSDAAWKAIGEILNYKSILNKSIAPSQANSEPAPGTYYSMGVSPEQTPPELKVVGIVPINQAAVLQPIGQVLNKGKTGNKYVFVTGGAAHLDFLETRNVIFTNVHLVYDGGPLIMNDTYFVNCTFEFPQKDQAKAKEFVLAVLKSSVTSFAKST